MNICSLGGSCAPWLGVWKVLVQYGALASGSKSAPHLPSHVAASRRERRDPEREHLSACHCVRLGPGPRGHCQLSRLVSLLVTWAGDIRLVSFLCQRETVVATLQNSRKLFPESTAQRLLLENHNDG